MGYFQKFQLWELFKIRKRNEEFHMSKITWDTKTSVVHGCVLISCLAKAQSEIRLAGHTFERRTQFQCVRCIYRDGSFGVCTLVILQVLVPVICLYCLIRAKVESVSCPNLWLWLWFFRAQGPKTVLSPLWEYRKMRRGVPRLLPIHHCPNFPRKFVCICTLLATTKTLICLNMKEYSQVLLLLSQMSHWYYMSFFSVNKIWTLALFISISIQAQLIFAMIFM